MKKTFFLLTGVLFVLLFLGCPNATETPKSNDADLQSLVVKDLEGMEIPLDSDFNAEKTIYIITVPYETKSLTVTGTKVDSKATMDPEDGVVTLNALDVGVPGLARIKVTAEDGTEKTYTVSVTRDAGSSNADLQSLNPSTGTLSPTFNADTLEYTITIPYATKSLTVTYEKTDANATMDPPDGELSFTHFVGNYSTEKTITVVSQDGSATKEYKVNVYRQLNDATLFNLTTDEGYDLKPKFNAATLEYTITVPNATKSLMVTGTKADFNATMDPVDGELSFTDLSEGSNEKTIKVTSEDGTTTQEYKVKVYRQSNDATLFNLTTDEGYDLKPKFNAATLEYTITVPNAKNTLTVTYEKTDANATMDPPDGESTYPLFEGLNEISIDVTSEDYSVTKKYKVKVTRCEKIEMVHVPAGSFQRDEEEENISVITKPYYLGKNQITRKQFKAIMGEDPSDSSIVSGTTDDEKQRNPVQKVNWYHAIAFCNKLSLVEGLVPAYSVKVDGTEIDWVNLAFGDIPTSSNEAWDFAECNWEANGYRLPTEMEWMWAAMGADQDDRPGVMQDGINRTGWSKNYAGEGYGTGNSINDYAWYKENSDGKTHPVGEKLPNELELYDMSGNVSEWCWDWHDIYSLFGKQTDYRGADSGSDRVHRGGSWIDEFCAVASRMPDAPWERYWSLGFRILRPVQ